MQKANQYYVKKAMKEEPLTKEIRQIHVSCDKESISNLITNDIYKDAYAGFRELYANAVRACKEAIKTYKADPRIEITINKRTLDFTMIEYDSIGITKDDFEKIVCIMGRSGNFDPNLPGQFGIGMLAYKTVTQNILIESMARNDEWICYLGRNGRTFDDLSRTNKPTFPHYGTKINFKMQYLTPSNTKRDLFDNRRLREAVNYIQGMCMFSGIRTDLIIKEDYEDSIMFMLDGDEKYHEGGRKWQIGSFTPMDVIKRREEDKVSNDDFIVISNDDYDLTILDICDKFDWTTLAGIPIETDNATISESHELRAFHSVVLNVKNERIYMPTASRDYFTDESKKRLLEKISKDLVKYVGNFKHVQTVDDYMKLSIGKRFFLEIMCGNFEQEIKKSGRGFVAILRLMKILNTECERNNRTRTLHMWLDDNESHYKNIYVVKNKEINYDESDAVIITPLSNFNLVAKYFKTIDDLNNDMVVLHRSDNFDKIYINRRNIRKKHIRVDDAETIATLCQDIEYAGHDYAFFEGKSGGTVGKNLIKPILKKKYAGHYGSDIINGKIQLILKEDAPLEYMGDIIGETYACINDKEYNELQLASIIQNKTTLFLMNSMDFLQKIYGYTDMLGMNIRHLKVISQSLERIKKQDPELANVIGVFYGFVAKIHDEGIVEKIIKKLENTIREAKKRKTILSKMLYVAVKMDYNLNILLTNAWINTFFNIRVPEYIKKELADAIADLYDGSDAKIKYGNEKAICTFNMRGDNFTIGGSIIEKLMQLQIIRGIENIQSSRINGEQITRVDFLVFSKQDLLM